MCEFGGPQEIKAPDRFILAQEVQIRRIAGSGSRELTVDKNIVVFQAYKIVQNTLEHDIIVNLLRKPSQNDLKPLMEARKLHLLAAHHEVSLHERRHGPVFILEVHEGVIMIATVYILYFTTYLEGALEVHIGCFRRQPADVYLELLLW